MGGPPVAASGGLLAPLRQRFLALAVVVAVLSRPCDGTSSHGSAGRAGGDYILTWRTLMNVQQPRGGAAIVTTPDEEASTPGPSTARLQLLSSSSAVRRSDEDAEEEDAEVASVGDSSAEASQGRHKAAVAKPKEDLEKPLKRNLRRQQALEEQVRYLNDQDALDNMVDAHVDVVSGETQSHATAEFLGDLWKEMRLYAAPFYEEHLEEELAMLKHRESEMRTSLGETSPQDEAGTVELTTPAAPEGKKDLLPPYPFRDPVAGDYLVVNAPTAPPKPCDTKAPVKPCETKTLEVAAPPVTVETGHLEVSVPAMPTTTPCGQAEATTPCDQKTVIGPAPPLNGQAPPLTVTMSPPKPQAVVADADADTSPSASSSATAAAVKDDDGTAPHPFRDVDAEPETIEVVNKRQPRRAPVKKAEVSGQPAAQEEKEEAVPKVEAEEEQETTTEAPQVEGAKSESEGSSLPMSTAATCIIILVWLFFIVYTLLAVSRSINQISGNRFPRCKSMQGIIESIRPTVLLAPMMSIFFLAVRLRANQLAKGMPHKYELPQYWVQAAMFVSTIGLLLQTIRKFLVAAVPLRGAVSRWAELIFGCCVYIGLALVCVGTIFMTGPSELWHHTQPRMSLAVECTIILGCLYFFVYLAVALMETAEKRRGRVGEERPTFNKLKHLFEHARSAVHLVPILCILFIAARMRAQQLRLTGSGPKECFFLCTAAVVVQVLCIVPLPLLDRGSRTMGHPSMGQAGILYSTRPLRIANSIVRYVLLLCIYGGAVALMVSMWWEKDREGEKGPPIAPSLLCTMGLATLYLVVHALLLMVQVAREYRPQSVLLTRLEDIDVGQRTAAFAPMLCALFLAARMRALQLARIHSGRIRLQAEPQHWVQESMYLASWAVLAQVLLAYAVVMAYGRQQGPDPSGADAFSEDDPQGLRPAEALEVVSARTPATEERSRGSADKRETPLSTVVAVLLDVAKYLSLVAMYGSAIAIMVGLCTMSPETLSG